MENIDAFTVTELTQHIKNVLENTIQPVWIEGELSNFKHHSSGHMYFSLKDEKSSINCVFFRQFNNYLRFTPENGMKVLCYGKVTVYEKRGQYQILVNQLKPLGTGELEIAFQQLKQKLQAEGLFDKDNKKDIPKYPENIGLITSSTGAAIQDIRNVISRRFPVKILLVSTRVQGEKAADEIVAAIQKFNQLNNVDVLILGRGGGSLEDLWSFNEEKVARAIFNSKLPVISAVGHEVDFTISDFVADLRAPTPSAAAELVVPDRDSIKEKINNIKSNIDSIILNKIKNYRNSVLILSSALKQNHPRYKLQQFSQQLDELNYLLFTHMTQVKDARIRVESLKSRFVNSYEGMYKNENLNIKELFNRLNNSVIFLFKDRLRNYDSLNNKLKELDPHKILARGYAIVKKGTTIITSIEKLNKGDKLKIKFADGRIICLVEKTSQK